MDLGENGVILSPDDREHQISLGQKLLELAECPSEVQWVSWPEAGFKISTSLYQKLVEAQHESVGAVTGVEMEPEPVKRKPGRPRKNPVPDTDNTEKEE